MGRTGRRRLRVSRRGALRYGGNYGNRRQTCHTGKKSVQAIPGGDSYVRALNGVNLEIRKGEFCSIVGTSGSGKSTLLNMLAGLEKPTRGEIIIAGEHLENKTENQLVRFRREHIGFIFQSFNLLGTMNAVENVALPLTFQGVDREIR